MPGDRHFSRRGFLLSSVATLMWTEAGAAVISGALPPWVSGRSSVPTPVLPGPWRFFTAAEATTMGAIVDRLIPADDLSPGGKDAGCVVFIDAQLAGPFGNAGGQYVKAPFLPGLPQQGYQGEDTPAGRYRKGLRALAELVATRFPGKSFVTLDPKDQDTLLKGLEAGTIPLQGVDAKGFFALVLQNTMEGFFADPIYGGNKNMVGWKMIGFPGARYDYRDWIDRHNEAYPLPPLSIMGRSAWNVQ